MSSNNVSKLEARFMLYARNAVLLTLPLWATVLLVLLFGSRPRSGEAYDILLTSYILLAPAIGATPIWSAWGYTRAQRTVLSVIYYAVSLVGLIIVGFFAACIFVARCE